MPKEIQSELAEVVGEQSEKTIVNYSNMLTRLRKALLTTTPIKNISPDVLIKTIKEMDIPATSKQSMNTVCIVIFKYHKLPVEKLIKFRDELADKSFDESKSKDTDLLSKGITLKMLTAFMNEAYANQEWKKFVINYLLLTFQTRNEDLDLMITKNGKATDGQHNWIVLKKASCTYIRNHYKTVDTYGPKIVDIRNKKLLEALHHILGDKGSEWLLKTGDAHIISTELNRAVANQTYEKMGSTKYFKILSTSKKNIEKMSANRGTNPDTIVHSYKLDKKVNLKKKKSDLAEKEE
jgi:hypothetical protein